MPLNLKLFNFREDKISDQNVIDLLPIGLPVYVVKMNCQIEAKRELDIASEMVLRLLNLSRFSESQIEGLLGLSKNFSRLILSDLIRSGMISPLGETDSVFMLSSYGERFVRSESVRQPEYFDLSCQYDGLLRRETEFPNSVLSSGPHILSEHGVRVYPLPNKRPDSEDFDASQLTRIIRKKINGKADASVLRVRSILNVRLKYVLGTLLISLDADAISPFLACYVEGIHAKEYDEVLNSAVFKKTFLSKNIEDFPRVVAEKEARLRELVSRFSRAPSAGGAALTSLAEFQELDFWESAESIVRALRSVDKPVVIQSTHLDGRLITDEFYELLVERSKTGAILTIVLSGKGSGVEVAQGSFFENIGGKTPSDGIEIIFANGQIENGFVISGEESVFLSFPPLAFAGRKDRQLSCNWGARSMSGDVAASVDRAFRRQWKLTPKIQVKKRRARNKKPGL